MEHEEMMARLRAALVELDENNRAMENALKELRESLPQASKPEEQNPTFVWL